MDKEFYSRSNGVFTRIHLQDINGNPVVYFYDHNIIKEVIKKDGQDGLH